MPEKLFCSTAVSDNIILDPYALEEIGIQGWHIGKCFSALANRNLHSYMQHSTGGEGS